MEPGSQSSNRQPIDVIFNSAESDNGNVDFPNFTLDPPLDNIVGASVQWISAPFSYYVIDRTNNFFRLGFYILIDQTSVATTDLKNALYSYNLAPQQIWDLIDPRVKYGQTTFTLPDLTSISNETISCELRYTSATIYLTPGSYTPESLEAEINKQMVATFHYEKIISLFKLPEIADIDEFSSFSVQLNPNTSKLSITNPNVPTNFVYITPVTNVKRHGRGGFFFTMLNNKSLGDILGFSSAASDSLTDIRKALYISSLTNSGETQTTTVDNTGIVFPFDPIERDYYVAGINAQEPCNLIETNKLNLHSNLATLMSVARTSKENNDILTCIPIDTNYSQYILNVQTAEMKMLTRCVISNVQFYMTLGQRRIYSNSGHETDFLNYDGDNTSEIISPTRYSVDEEIPALPFTTQPYIHFNGEPFMVCIRFYRDDGQMAQ